MTPEELVEYLEAHGFDAERRAEASLLMASILSRLELAQRIERIESVLGKLIAWSVGELGEFAAKELIAELGDVPNAKLSYPDTSSNSVKMVKP